MANPQSKNQPQIVTGRRVRGLPSASPEQNTRALLKQRIDREKQHGEEKHALEAKLAAAERDKHLLESWAFVERTARRRAAEVQLSAPDTTRLVNSIEKQWQQHLGEAKPATSFDYLHVMGTQIAKLTNGVPPTKDETPASTRAGSPEAKASSDAYVKRLRELGLELPGQGSPGAFSRPF